MRHSYLICDPLPSEVGDYPATYVLRVIEPATLWVFYDDDDDQGEMIKSFEDLSKFTPAALARIAREVGEFWNQYRAEEDEI